MVLDKISSGKDSRGKDLILSFKDLGLKHIQIHDTQIN